MQVFDWLLIGLAIVFVAIFILVIVGAFKVPTPPVPDAQTFSNLYTPTSPWRWDADNSSIPVPGIDGECNVYTFTTNQQFAPANISFTNINGCSTTDTSNVNSSVGSSCISSGSACTCSPPQP